MNLRNSIILCVFLLLQSCAYKKVVNQPITAEKETIYKVIKETEVVHDTVKEYIEVNCEPMTKVIDVNIYFSFDSYELDAESRAVLDRVMDIRSVPLQVIGYTCPIGEEAYNHKLALKRAQAVYNYLNLSEPHVVGSRGEKHDCENYVFCRKVVVSGQN